MHRRHLLESVGASAAGLAGCLGSSGPSEGDEPSTRTPDSTPEGGESSTRTPVSERTFGVDVTVESQPTADEPARLTVSVTNESETAWTYPIWPPYDETDHRVPFDDCTSSGDRDERLFLIPDFHDLIGPGDQKGQLLPDTPTDGCWKAGYDRTLEASAGGEPTELPPDESFRETYSVLRAESTDCSRAVTGEFTAWKKVTAKGNEYVVEPSLTLELAADGIVSVQSRGVTVSTPTPEA